MFVGPLHAYAIDITAVSLGLQRQLCPISPISSVLSFPLSLFATRVDLFVLFDVSWTESWTTRARLLLLVFFFVPSSAYTRSGSSRRRRRRTVVHLCHLCCKHKGHSFSLSIREEEKNRVNVYTTVGERAFRYLCVNHSASRRRRRRRRRRKKINSASLLNNGKRVFPLPFVEGFFLSLSVLFADSRSHRSDSSHRIAVTTRKNNKIKRKTNTRMLTSIESTLFSSLSSPSQFNLGLQHFVSSSSSSELF